MEEKKKKKTEEKKKKEGAQKKAAEQKTKGHSTKVDTQTVHVRGQTLPTVYMLASQLSDES
ncbi:hypothetical protein DNTS_028799 [Danionella cerebrum]|uniref:Uncharacterized protein n=1 Tax=Danionella cerebrum TaxID=2873325 RepID=A0A553NMX1_9TELE|nr:hypothetical protein DNTS_028799 [Danionella translucida]